MCFGHAGALEQVTLAPPFVGRPYPPRDGGAPRVLSREPRAQRPRRRGARAEREARRECVGVAEHRSGYTGEVSGHLSEGEGGVGVRVGLAASHLELELWRARTAPCGALCNVLCYDLEL